MRSQQKAKQQESGEIVGKVAFYRDKEVSEHPAERVLGRWVK